MRLEVRFVLSFGQFIATRTGRLVKHASIAGSFDKLDHGVRKPQPVIRDARAYSAARRRMPPVLNVSGGELMRSRPQNMLARNFTASRGERHDILNLIAGSIRSAQLVKGGPGKNTAAQCLVQDPAINQNIHCPVGRLILTPSRVSSQ